MNYFGIEKYFIIKIFLLLYIILNACNTNDSDYETAPQIEKLYIGLNNGSSPFAVMDIGARDIRVLDRDLEGAVIRMESVFGGNEIFAFIYHPVKMISYSPSSGRVKTVEIDKPHDYFVISQPSRKIIDTEPQNSFFIISYDELRYADTVYTDKCSFPSLSISEPKIIFTEFDSAGIRLHEYNLYNMRFENSLFFESGTFNSRRMQPIDIHLSKYDTRMFIVTEESDYDFNSFVVLDLINKSIEYSEEAVDVNEIFTDTGGRYLYFSNNTHYNNYHQQNSDFLRYDISGMEFETVIDHHDLQQNGYTGILIVHDAAVSSLHNRAYITVYNLYDSTGRINMLEVDLESFDIVNRFYFNDSTYDGDITQIEIGK